MEKLHTFFTFPLLTIYFVSENPLGKSLFFVYGMILCIIILFQGQKYWYLKLKSLERKPFSQSENLKFFKKSKRTNLILISPIPVVMIFQILLINWSISDFNILLWSILANLFAVLEHINYYHTQLMVDNKSDLIYLIRNKRLKTASLAKDLKENSIWNTGKRYYRKVLEAFTIPCHFLGIHELYSLIFAQKKKLWTIFQ